MADINESPNGLAPLKNVNVSKMSRWPLYAILAAALVIFGVLFYSVNFAHDPAEEEAKNAKVSISESEQPLLMGEGRGLALAPPPGAALVTVPAPQATPSKEKPFEPLVVVQGPKEGAQVSQEHENLRRMRIQSQLSALSAPLGVKKASDTASKAAPVALENEKRGGFEQAPTDPYGVKESSYDPTADKDKEAFFNRSKQADTEWILPNSRAAGQPLEVKTGTVVPGIMVTGINSDLPGNIIAQVSQNVWDTATGRNLLIPQGAKLFGVYDSRVVYGQERVLVAWNRLVFPDGSSFTLGAMPGADLSGNAGYTDEVNNHYMRIFGSAIMMSLVTGGMSYSMDALRPSNSGDNNNNPTTLQDEMGAALASQLGQATVQMLQKNLNIKPTLEIRPGYQFNIVVTKDLVFERPYTAWR